MWKSLKPVLLTVLKLILPLLFGGLGLFLNQTSFSSIREMRQLERIPATKVQAVLPGEVNLTGTAVIARQRLSAPKTRTPCVYYRYLVERESRDSDGNTTWTTIEDRTSFVPFVLEDQTGRIAVHPSSAAKFSLPNSYRRIVGSRRYTEWRIDSGDRLFLFGYAHKSGGAPRIRFDVKGQYTPLVSKYQESEERSGMATTSMLFCWGSLVALAFAVLSVCWLVRIHRTLIYLLILSLALTIALGHFGLRMMKADLTDARGRLDHHVAAAKQAVRETLTESGISWSGSWRDLGDLEDEHYAAVPSEERRRLHRIRMDVATAAERMRKHRTAFPERLLAPMWKISEEPEIKLPSFARAELRSAEARFVPARLRDLWAWIGLGVGAIGLAFFSWRGFRQVRFKRYIENLPTSKTAGVVYGLSEIKGVILLAADQKPLEGPISNKPCVQYHYLVREKVGSGKRSHWVTRVDEKEGLLFLCTDEEGSLVVDPEGAEVITKHTTTRREGSWHYKETRLETGDPLYALGHAGVEPTEGTSLQLGKGDDSLPYILSNYSEGEVLQKKAMRGMLGLNLAFSGLLLAALALFGQAGSFAATDYLAAALIAPIYMTFVMLVLHYNDLVFLRERVDRNWANIEVSLKKRHDLIPNLEKVVKGYLSHEKSVLESLARMRDSYHGGAIIDPTQLSTFLAAEQSFLDGIRGLREAYPDLKGDEQAGKLMRALIQCDNEVALMRAGYNDAVEAYNTRRQSFPDLIFAKIFGFEPKQHITFEAKVHEVPKVELQDETEAASSR